MRLHRNGQLDLDFIPLLLAEHAFVDIRTFESITYSRKLALLRAGASLRKLCDAGFLEVIDYKIAAEGFRSNIIETTNQRILNPMAFKGKIIESNHLWDEVCEPLSVAMELAKDPVSRIPLGIVHAMKAENLSYTPSNASKLIRILEKKKNSKTELSLVSEIIRPYLEHVLSHIAVMRHYNTQIIDWKDMEPIYNAILFDQLEHYAIMQTDIPTARKIFSYHLSLFQPETVEDFLYIIKDRRIINFRSFVSHCADNKNDYNPAVAQSLINDLIKLRHNLSRIGTTLNIVSAVSGVMLGLIDSSLLAAASGAAIGLVSQEVLTHLIEGLLSKNIDWALPFVEQKRGKNRPQW